jgi:hypothetical protein
MKIMGDKLPTRSGLWKRNDLYIWIIDLVRDDCRIIAEYDEAHNIKYVHSPQILPYEHLPKDGWWPFKEVQR